MTTAEKKILGGWAKALRWASVVGTAAALTACGGGGGSAGNGNLRVALTDAPSCGYDHVFVHQIGEDQAGFLRFYANEILARV